MAGCRQHMTGYEMYKANLAIIQHFTKAKFDFLNGSRIRFSEEKYDARGDHVFYEKFAERYPKGDLLRFIMVNVTNGKKHISEYSDSDFRDWKHKIGGLEYHFEKDCKFMFTFAAKHGIIFQELFKSATGGLPIVLQMMNGNHIMIETLCLIDSVLNGSIVRQMDEQVTDMFLYPKLRMKITKYQGWIPYEKDVTMEILRKFIQ